MSRMPVIVKEIRIMVLRLASRLSLVHDERFVFQMSTVNRPSLSHRMMSLINAVKNPAIIVTIPALARGWNFAYLIVRKASHTGIRQKVVM